MNLLDKAIGWIAPGAGLKRVRARTAMGMLARSYEGAKAGRRTDGWVAAGSSANAEIGPALPRLRARSRDLVRNNPYAAKAIDALVSNLVGTGIVPQSTDEKHRERIAELWDAWAGQCDADGQHDFYGLQALIVRTVKESGECFVRRRMRRPEDGLEVPFQIQVLEPDYLDSTRTGDLAGGGYIQEGIEFDALGRRVAYWMYSRHPGEAAGIKLKGGLESKRIPASDVLHIYEKKRPGQIRGVPASASVLILMRDLDEYDEAVLVRKKIEACFAAFVTQPEGQDTQALGKVTTNAAGQRVESFEPGMVEYLRPGETVEFGNPQASGGEPDYRRDKLRAAAAGWGVTYEQLTGDYSQVTFSSARMGGLEFRRQAEQFQWMVFVPMACLPVWEWFHEVCALTGKLRGASRGVEWSTPKWEYSNPLQDAKADKELVSGGLMTLSQAIRRLGYDPLQVFKERAEELKLLKDLGIVTDTDPQHKNPPHSPNGEEADAAASDSAASA